MRTPDRPSHHVNAAAHPNNRSSLARLSRIPALSPPHACVHFSTSPLLLSTRPRRLCSSFIRVCKTNTPFCTRFSYLPPPALLCNLLDEDQQTLSPSYAPDSPACSKPAHQESNLQHPSTDQGMHWYTYDLTVQTAVERIRARMSFFRLGSRDVASHQPERFPYFLPPLYAPKALTR